MVELDPEKERAWNTLFTALLAPDRFSKTFRDAAEARFDDFPDYPPSEDA